MFALRGSLGIAALLLIAWLLSSDRRRFPIRIALAGIGLQFSLALLVLKTSWGSIAFDYVGEAVTYILAGADKGAEFVFGPLAGNNPDVAWKAIAGIKIMTTIITFSTLSAIGYHYGILQAIVVALARLLNRILGVSGAESLSGAANVFLGQTEAPLLVRPFLAGMTRSELMAVMTGGFATIALGVMAVYVAWLGVDADGQPDKDRAREVARHLLTASLMSAPAAFVMAKIMVPESQTPATGAAFSLRLEREHKNVLDAATAGASQGMTLAINVLAMLIAFIALIAVINLALENLGKLQSVAPIVARVGLPDLTLQSLFGWIFSPIAMLLGVERNDSARFGSLLATAMSANEMVAYASLRDMLAAKQLEPRSVKMAMYSLCGFANISSMGIQIAGIGSLAPSRRKDLVELAPRAMLGGAMASWMTGCIAGMMLE
ncbi:MAG: nucleoside transporter C-terminal domain-containing protein [Phycisphaerae bacterium]